MAEVPEVETIVRDLREAVVGRKIHETEVLLPAAVRFPTVNEFTTLLTDRLVLESNRRAKYILLPLSGDLVLAVHFALWGTLALVPTDQARLPETLIIWHLDQEQDLRLIDKLGYARAATGPPEILAERLDVGGGGAEAREPTWGVDGVGRQRAERRGVLRTVRVNERVLA